LDTFLKLTEHPLVQLADFGPVFLLAAHLFGGLRRFALQWPPWSDTRKTLASGAGAVGVAVLVSGTFFLNAI
jgi:fumarate reductase subunit D